MAKIYIVASGKGGVGKSTLTAGLARMLSELNKKVLAIDCDIGLRSLDILLGYDDKVVFDWGDVITGRCQKEDAVIKGDVDFIAAPRSYDEAYTGEALKEFIDSIKIGYDYIFLDAPAGIGTGFNIAAASAEYGIAVTTPDNVCVRSCGRACEELNKHNIDDIRLVINMFEAKPVVKKKLLNIDECIDETGVQLLGVIPLDRILAFASVTGVAPGEFSASEQAFYRLAKRITGERVPLVCE